VDLFLELVGHPSGEQITAQPGRRRRSVQTAPLDLKIGNGQSLQRGYPGIDSGAQTGSAVTGAGLGGPPVSR
jgi:hypothetical protein